MIMEDHDKAIIIPLEFFRTKQKKKIFVLYADFLQVQVHDRTYYL